MAADVAESLCAELKNSCGETKTSGGVDDGEAATTAANYSFFHSVAGVQSRGALTSATPALPTVSLTLSQGPVATAATFGRECQSHLAQDPCLARPQDLCPPVRFRSRAVSSPSWLSCCGALGS